MEGWRPLHQVLTPVIIIIIYIIIPTRCLWTLVAWGTEVKNESELATLILRLFSHMAKIFPSRDGNGTIISSASCHI